MAREQVEILTDRCVGCGLCVKGCPFAAITMRDRLAVIDYDTCTLCGACAPICSKFEAIRFEPRGSAVAATGRGNVWVCCEAHEGDLLRGTLELLGAARGLADDLGVKVVAVLLTDAAGACPQRAIAGGADTVLVVEDPALEQFRDDAQARIIARIIQQNQPEIVLGGATAVGRALLPRVAILVRTGLTADCTELSIDPETGLLLQTRPAFGGNIMATITCERGRPQMATVRPGVLPLPEGDSNRQGDVVRVALAPGEGDSTIDWLGFRASGEGGVDLREAPVIVAAGRGVGGSDGVALIQQLATALGGALGASRSVVDAGWIEYPHQVGQTGTTVQPKLYVACGISGAIQHLVGMQNSDRIIAINKDPDAPIFDHADVAVVGDLHAIIPEILKQLEARHGCEPDPADNRV